MWPSWKGLGITVTCMCVKWLRTVLQLTRQALLRAGFSWKQSRFSTSFTKKKAIPLTPLSPPSAGISDYSLFTQIPQSSSFLMPEDSLSYKSKDLQRDRHHCISLFHGNFLALWEFIQCKWCSCSLLMIFPSCFWFTKRGLVLLCYRLHPVTTASPRGGGPSGVLCELGQEEHSPKDRLQIHRI